MRILTCEQMKTVEAQSVENGSTYIKLMENAGVASFECIYQYEKSLKDKRCVVLCGNGNNGGDGFVIARKLLQEGSDIVTILVNGNPKTREAKEMFEIYLNAGGDVIYLSEDLSSINMLLLNAQIIIDAIFGTGFKGILPENLNLISSIVNMSHAVKYSIDIPSGMEGDTGMITNGKCFSSDITIALEALKPAHLVQHDIDYFGIIECVSIGITEDSYKNIYCNTFYIDEEMAYSTLHKRPRNSHKGNFGRLLCVCGSVGMTGAAILSTSSAIHSGSGLVYLACPESISSIVSSHLIEPIIIPLPENELGSLSYSCTENILNELRNKNACLIGCGIRVNYDTENIFESIIENANCPLIIDADGINILSTRINILQKYKSDIILTPHPGEMARLTHTSIEYVNNNRAEIASDFAKTHNVVVVLKGHNTIVASPTGEVFINSTGNPGLAKAGSGDLLAGMIASFVAQGIDAVVACINGVYLHGLAADYTMNRLSQFSMTASDIIQDYHKVFKRIDLLR